MPRVEGQKRKLLALLQILIRDTDENHPLSWWKSCRTRALFRSARVSTTI